MPKSAPASSLPPLQLDRASATPLSRQLHAEIVRVILDGRARAGVRLPSTRNLSAELGIARNTVNSAYDQLAAEGYIESRVGSGTCVASSLQGQALRAVTGDAQQRDAGTRRHLSQRGARAYAATSLADAFEGTDPRVGHPDLDAFPFATWKRLLSRQIDALARSRFGYTAARGYEPLHEAIVQHLARTRGMSAIGEQVIVVSGTQQALDLCARALLDPRDRILFEDPGYIGARMAFVANGLTLSPVPVDDAGMDVARSPVRTARAAYVTPAHQYPLGSQMSLARRLALLEWARSCDAWIFEDDYDGEYRYAGEPLSSLASLDASGRVIYIGSFSKVLFPALRLGFIVAPAELARRIASIRGFVDRASPMLEQATLAAFMEQGYFAQHLRRMRALYAERRALLLAALREHGDGSLDVLAPETGTIVVVRLPDGVDDTAVAKAFGNEGPLAVLPMSGYCMRPPIRAALLVGFTQARPRDIVPATKALLSTIARLRR
jgi:GntR family transcriptional regulator/MocR family aminotransferase